ncbi:ubiquitin-specific protease 26 [Actinidia rufa]|uniref:Ubiquitin carboxyl-terminal hydrolase n=1 Tax=Actinidia rufa TaxID=165716 RepID=A0A7J0GXT1_9ERIC|nr:ubiquitin-specific protease 26 [Actinidia rufa]
MGQVTEDDVNKLYMIWKPICQGCRVNTKDNPNCFCGLVPPPNGSRKSGLWQKMSEILLSLGPDPSQDLRASTNSPAGLTNLGATCYANSILQCLYMIKSFREGVFSVEPDVLKEQPVLYQLARLFAQLHASKKAFVDSAPFIKTLELDNAVQQDSHEFLTLLFSLLERCLSCSKVSKARTIVQDLFRGSVSHVTTCLKCGKDSEASFKMEDFYELELNVKGLKSLEASLDDYLSVEELQGDNQYYCESCTIRVDATRSIKLRSLPAVLNFQLKRCVFLPKTTTKKKITSAFCFPGELDMGHRLPEYSQSKLIYDLAAVLIHKGSAVNSGHYVAHIKDENTGQWWEFDDEDVSNLGQHPFGEGCSVAAKAVQTEPVIHPSCSELMDNLAIGNHAGASQPKSSDSDDSVHTFSSSDAYMLMYILRNSNNVGQKGQMDSGGIKMENDSGVAPQNGISLPSHLCEEIEQLNSSYVNDCKNYKSKKEIEFNHITEQRQEVRSILSQAPVQSLGEPYFWISTDWLRHWADNISPLIIDNNPIQCLHGKVPVSKIGNIKRLSAKAWTLLFSKGCCDSKEDGLADSRVGGEVVEVERNVIALECERPSCSTLVGQCESGEFGELEDSASIISGTIFSSYLSSSYCFASSWVRKGQSESHLLEKGEEAQFGRSKFYWSSAVFLGSHMKEEKTMMGLLSELGSLYNSQEEKLGSLRWAMARVLSFGRMRGPTLAKGDYCVDCLFEVARGMVSADSYRDRRTSMKELADAAFAGNFLDGPLYYVSKTWLQHWIRRKNIDSPCEADAEPTASIRCPHGDLKPEQATGAKRVLVPENWGGTEEEGISTEIEVSNCMENDTVVVSAEMPISEEHMNTHDEINGETESKRFMVKTRPEHSILELNPKDVKVFAGFSNYYLGQVFIAFKVPVAFLDTVIS